jgi:acetylornithine deacetylase
VIPNRGPMASPSSVSISVDPADLTVRLMAIDSTTGQEGAVVAWLAEFLSDRGWTTTRIPVSAGRDDLWATADDLPTVTLSTHLDTVPPFIAPRREGSRIWGRGACDAKGIAAAMVCAASRLRTRGISAGLLFVVGEEVSHDGAHAANDYAITHGTTSRFLINGEPTESTLAVGTKGAIRATIRTAGRAAHSAYPHLGQSATRDLVHLLVGLDALELPADELLGETTVNIGHLFGGVADNVVAPWAEARLMIRLVTPAADIQPIIERWAGGRASVEWGVMAPAVRLGVLPGFPTSVAAFATDIPALPAWGKPYLFGPGSIHVAHRDDEFIEVGELEAAVDAYERLVVELSG